MDFGFFQIILLAREVQLYFHGKSAEFWRHSENGLRCWNVRTQYNQWLKRQDSIHLEIETSGLNIFRGLNARTQYNQRFKRQDPIYSEV